MLDLWFQRTPLRTSRSKLWSSGNVASKSISRRLYASCFTHTVDCTLNPPPQKHKINCVPSTRYQSYREIVWPSFLETYFHLMCHRIHPLISSTQGRKAILLCPAPIINAYYVLHQSRYKWRKNSFKISPAPQDNLPEKNCIYRWHTLCTAFYQ